MTNKTHKDDVPTIPDDWMEPTYREFEYRIKMKMDLLDALNNRKLGDVKKVHELQNTYFSKIIDDHVKQYLRDNMGIEKEEE